MNTTITIDLNEFDHIPENSRYNCNYYRMKLEHLRDRYTQCEIYQEVDEFANSCDFYHVDSQGTKHFLFSCHMNESLSEVYTGDLFDRWS